MLSELFISLFVSVIFWMFNLEKGQGLGGIWLRPNHEGKIVFAYRSLIKLLIEPLHNTFYWKFKNWDINFYIIFGISFSLIFLLKKMEP